MSIESAEDLAGMQAVGRVVATTLAEMQAEVRVGMTTAALDQVAARVFRRLGARSAPQVIYGFPGYTCLSVNEEIVHGVPGPRTLQPGDVLKIDVTAELGGFVADAATTVVIGIARGLPARMKRSAQEALRTAIGVARAGDKVSVIGRAIESRAQQDGFSVVRELCGHGVGRAIHEDPDVPNYENPRSQDCLTPGLVIAIEPMLTPGLTGAILEDDGWTIRTANRTIAVHEEHTVVIRDDDVVVLTA